MPSDQKTEFLPLAAWTCAQNVGDNDRNAALADIPNMGTMRMSADPAAGVVDRWGRAHEIDNLFVADGSIFTTSAAANPTLTIVALAMRQSEEIVRQLNRQ
ncbi:hypothetical protein ICI42_19220 [Tianweitania sp. Rool2]|uniref:Glucose-methanol-choline oxidoreductase C-terminal domain-containing protein n=2 Tax=Oryzicola mucosus TaxID=2767425 RepID=A0A8J6U982_9HYPH|nr:hypothetical protein [Oryzicola mucosus]